MSREARFWDKTARKYARSPIADEAAYQHKLEKTREYFTPEMDVLEFGCGTGSTALLHAPFVNHIRATDLSAEMIEIAKEKAAADGVANVTFERASIEEINAAEGSFGAVLGLSILHLLPDYQGAIEKSYRWLKPGGAFVTSTACLGDMSVIYRIILPVGHALGFFPPVKILTQKELVADLRAAGFEIEYEWTLGKGKALFVIARKPG